MIGVAERNDFNNHLNTFQSTMTRFSALTDSEKINRKPERVRVKTVQHNGTLAQAFESFSVSNKRMEELAILNGMQLKDRVERRGC